MHKESCRASFILKTTTVFKLGIKYYLPFHLIPLILRLKKCKEGRKMAIILLRTAYEYVKSVLFMAFLVGGVKSVQCMYNNASIPLDGKDRSI